MYRLSNQRSVDEGPFLTISGDSGAVLPSGQANVPFVRPARNSSAADNYFPIMIDNPTARYRAVSGWLSITVNVVSGIVES